MLTLEMLYVVLQGVPSDYFDHLDRPWFVFCQNLAQVIAKGGSPQEALRFAIGESERWQMDAIRNLLLAIGPAMQIPGLSYRQKEILLALRTAKVASLTQLSHIIGKDRSNTHKHLAKLVARGLAIKFYRPGGPHYFAVTTPFSREFRKQVHDILLPLLADPSTLPQPKLDIFGRPLTEFETQLIAEAKASAAQVVARYAQSRKNGVPNAG
jgi:DNA-binding MarR family transcriptional regulator